MKIKYSTLFWLLILISKYKKSFYFLGWELGGKSGKIGNYSHF